MLLPWSTQNTALTSKGKEFVLEPNMSDQEAQILIVPDNTFLCKQFPDVFMVTEQQQKSNK